MKKILSFVLLAALLTALPFTGRTQDWRASAPYHCGFDDPVENAAWILLNGVMWKIPIHIGYGGIQLQL